LIDANNEMWRFISDSGTQRTRVSLY